MGAGPGYWSADLTPNACTTMYVRAGLGYWSADITHSITHMYVRAGRGYWSADLTHSTTLTWAIGQPHSTRNNVTTKTR